MWDWIQEKESSQYKTLQDWSKAGYKVKRGSKSVRVNGKCVFSQYQVEPFTPSIKPKMARSFPLDKPDFYID